MKSNTISTGLAMFSMFFGAGNVVYPLAMGQYAQDQNFYAILGLMITGIGVPFLGLLSMTLYDGDYHKFFGRIGKVPGFIITLCIMGLIGPFGAMPRVVALSYSTAKMFLPDVGLEVFSVISCLIIYLLTFKRSRILDILGYVLTPVLLGSLVILIVKALINPPAIVAADDSTISIFFQGLYEGYYTMDLMGAFFFSSVVILCLKKELKPTDKDGFKKLIIMTLKASCIGASLLAAVYVGFSYVAAYHSEFLSSIPQDEMLGALAVSILGANAGIIAVIAVALACLTTAIAIAAVFAEFLHEDITQMKVSYRNSLIITLVLTFFMSTLNFVGLMQILKPILIVCTPALIMLSFVNLLEKLYGFQWVKVPVGITFGISLLAYFSNTIEALLS